MEGGVIIDGQVMGRTFLALLVVFAVIGAPICAADAPAQPGVVDLLKLVDPQQQTLLIGWRLIDGTLVSDPTKPSHIEFPYVPPQEYDYRVVFTRSSGNGYMACICHGGDRQFVWRMGSAQPTAAAGFGVVDGKNFGQNVSSRSGKWLLTGEQEELVIQIRRDGVQAILNDVPISRLKTNYRNVALGSVFKQTRDDTIGLFIAPNDLTVESAEVIEISGPGQIIK